MPACDSSVRDPAGHGSLTSSGLTCSFAVVIVERWNGAAVLRLFVLRERVSERASCVASTNAGSRHDPSSLPVLR